MEKQENYFKGSKGITLLALVVTIIILIILAGITINLVLGENGLIEKTKLASEESKYATAEEKVKMAVMGSYDETATLNKELLKKNLNNIQGIYEKVEEVTYDLNIIVDGFEFTITEIGQVIAVGRNNNILPENTPTTEAGKEVKMPEGWYTTTSAYVSTEDGSMVQKQIKVASVTAIATGGGETVPVPNGFYYVGGTISSGVVISDDVNDQNAYAGQSDVGKDLKGNQFVWIPCELSDYKKIDWGKENAKWDMETNVAEYEQIEKYSGFYIGRYEAGVATLNAETNEFENSVTFNDNASLFNAVALQTGLNNWGWQNYNYTARQTGTVVPTGSNKATGNVVVKANSIPYYHADYYTAVEMSRRLYNNNSSVQSGLVTGTQWDMMMKFMQDGGVDVTSTNWGNYDNVKLENLTGYYTNVTTAGATDGFKSCTGLTNTNSSTSTYVLLTTAATEQVKQKNLYDVAGNLWEWTEEASYIDNLDYNMNSTLNSYMLRGGAFCDDYATYPACFRGHNYAARNSTGYGFRLTLYIK